MTGIVRYNGELQIIETVFQGPNDPEMIMNIVFEAYQTSIRNNCSHVLADCRKLERADYSSPFDIIKLSAYYDDLQIRQNLREAVLLPEDLKAAELIKFYETVLSNRGFEVQLFNNYNEAIAWLKS